jgi:hypothetical protein
MWASMATSVFHRTLWLKQLSNSQLESVRGQKPTYIGFPKPIRTSLGPRNREPTGNGLGGCGDPVVKDYRRHSRNGVSQDDSAALSRFTEILAPSDASSL